MKTIFKISAILIAIFLLISLNSASAQWVSGSSSGSSLTDVIVFDSNAGAAYVSGTFSPTDPLSVYDNMYTQGPAHYYRIVASTTTGSSSFLLSDNSSQWVTLTILDSNLKKIVTANALTGYVSGNRSALLNYTMTSGSTYYVETHCLGSVGGAVPFTFVISGGVSSISQVEQGAHGVGSGVPLFNGALLGNSAASHARPGCYADYYQLTGDGVTDLIMSGFDTYLYLYDSQFHLIAKNDDANPPGHGGSLIHQILSMGSVAMSGTTIHDAGAALIFTSGTVTATKNTVISSNTWIDYTYWYNINTGAILYYTFDFISDFSTNISTDLVTGTSGVGSKVIDGSQTLATSFVTVASGSGSTVNPGVGTHISGTTNTWNEVWNPNTMSYNVTISSGTVSIPVTGGTCSLTTGSSTTITTGTGYELIQLPFFVEATSYTKHLTLQRT